MQIGDAVGEFVEQLGDHVLNGGTAIRFGTYLARISPGPLFARLVVSQLVASKERGGVN